MNLIKYKILIFSVSIFLSSGLFQLNVTVFPQMVIASGTEGFTYTKLEDIEQRYEEIGQQHPQNYGWFQCRWHSAAADIYEEGGVDTFIKLWNAFKTQQENLNDREFADFLSQQVHPSVGDVMLKWDE